MSVLNEDPMDNWVTEFLIAITAFARDMSEPNITAVKAALDRGVLAGEVKDNGSNRMNWKDNKYIRIGLSNMCSWQQKKPSVIVAGRHTNGYGAERMYSLQFRLYIKKKARGRWCGSMLGHHPFTSGKMNDGDYIYIIPDSIFELLFDKYPINP